MKKFVITAFLILMSTLANAGTQAACHGQFPNLFTDICWDCAFPIKLFGVPVVQSDSQEDYDSGSIPNLCVCTPPGSLVPKAGWHMSFWEFARQAEVTRTPYCMVTLGMSMDMGINSDMMGSGTMDPTNAHGNRTTFRHVHWYINPVMGLMQVLLDSKCLEPSGFDIAYMSEIDPTHSDEELERILNPEAYLFGNVVAQLACSADCIASTISFGSNLLYWCDGCNGTVFPMTGFMPATYGGVQASSLMVHKITAKLHRMLTQWSAAGVNGMCGYTPQINMDKRQYKYSMIYPSAQSSGDPAAYPTTSQGISLAGASGITAQNGDVTAVTSGSANTGAMNAYATQSQQAQQSQLSRCCQPYGRTSIIWGAGREMPVTGEDFGYAIFRKKDCCQN